MQRFFHIFLITSLLGLGLAEASERVFQEVTTAVDAASGEHVHHDNSAGHDADSVSDHCADCCHAPCFWLGCSGFMLPVTAESSVIRGTAVRRYSSARPPVLIRPPIV